MPTFFFSAIFFLGLFVGSFLNVIIYRLYSGEQFLRGRSHCPHCGHTLSWYELVPVISFIMQGAKCRACAKPISWQYPFVELATGVLFAFATWHVAAQIDLFSQSVFYLLSSIFYLLVISGLIVIFVYDFKHYIIPDSILIVLIAGTCLALIGGILDLPVFLHLGEGAGFAGSLENMLNGIVSGICASLPFFAISILSKGMWMGLGDGKFAFFMGMLLGMPYAFVALFLAIWLGAIIGVALIIAGKKGLKSEVPFGPFLIIGTFFALFWGNDIWNFYLQLVGF
jgi:leader peptidase (prepilin peptidase) / N-methyltransferase